ncbi:hypothetical protein NC652_032037 [Populus alba x Populus x berolinensis]|nr:hypothetical protein NC652_032037 [Populus alba x Populus x berolinensis]
MRLVNVAALKLKLGMEATEFKISDLLEAWQRIGIATNHDEAVTFAHVLAVAWGLSFSSATQVYLHPDNSDVAFACVLVRYQSPVCRTRGRFDMKSQCRSL